MNSVPQGDSPLISLARLCELAGERIFERGREYFNRGLVVQVAEGNGSVTALVLGTQAYQVCLRDEGGWLSFHCDCPFGCSGKFCKHAVALGLFRLKRESCGAPVATCEQLLEYVINSLSMGESIFADEMWRRRIESTLDEVRSKPVTESIEITERMLGMLVEARCLGSREEGDHREWEWLEDLLCECHLAVCRQAMPKAETSLRRFLDWQLKLVGAGIDMGLTGKKLQGGYVESCGDDWNREYQGLIEERLRELSRFDQERTSLLQRRQLVWLRHQVEDGMSRIAEDENGNREEKEIESLWQEFSVLPTLRVYERLKERAMLLSQWPQWRARALEDLRRWSRRLNKSSVEKKKRGRPAEKDEDNSEPVKIWLSEGELNSAWDAAQAGDCTDDLWLKLAALRVRQHPSDALVIYQRQIRKLLRRKDYYSAQEAKRILSKTRRLMKRLNREEEYKRYLEGLFRAFGSQRNFAEIIDKNLDAIKFALPETLRK